MNNTKNMNNMNNINYFIIHCKEHIERLSNIDTVQQLLNKPITFVPMTQTQSTLSFSTVRPLKCFPILYLLYILYWFIIAPTTAKKYTFKIFGL